MTLDSSVMNVSIATVADDLGTTVTGIQGAITAYTPRDGVPDDHRRQDRRDHRRKRAFAIGCIIYGVRLVHDLARAQPARAALRVVASSKASARALILPGDRGARRPGTSRRAKRPAAYGMVAAAGAIAVAVGPLVGGFCTTYFSVALGFRRRGGRRARNPACSRGGSPDAPDRQAAEARPGRSQRCPLRVSD